MSLPYGTITCSACGTSVAQQAQAAPYSAAQTPQAATVSYSYPYATSSPQQAAAPTAAAGSYHAPAQPAPASQPSEPSYSTPAPSSYNSSYTPNSSPYTQTTLSSYGSSYGNATGASAYNTSAAPGNTYGGASYPYGQPIPTPIPAKPKKKNPLIPISIVLVLAILAGFIGNSRYTEQQAEKVQAEYTLVAETVCDASSPRMLLSNSALLEAFKSRYPEFKTDPDLQKLIDACAAYDFASENESRYLDMIAALEDLESSSVNEVADCATNLLTFVREDYEFYKEQSIEPAPLPPPDKNNNDDDLVHPFPAEFPAVIDVFEGLPCYGIFATNLSSKTIVYFEVWLFCYDDKGNPIESSANLNLEWGRASVDPLTPGDFISPADGVFPLTSCPEAAIGLPFVNYVEFSDGTSYGITDDSLSPEIQAIIDELKGLMDEMAKVYV